MTVPTKPQIRAGNLWSTYVTAWICGAKSRSMDPKFTEHTNAEIRAAYARGYQAGRDARNIAAQDAAQIYGYEPSVLRIAESRVCDCTYACDRMASLRPDYLHQEHCARRKYRCGIEGCRLPPEHDGDHKYGRNVP